MATQSDAAATTPELDCIWRALKTVADPEIPVVTVIDMGMIAGVSLDEGRARVAFTPTFAGCPAVDLIRSAIAEALRLAGFPDAQIDVVYDPPWSTDRITPEGRRKLKDFGLAPPTKSCGGPLVESNFHAVPCPLCNSTDTTLESLFGPTLCRSIHYCNACRNSFEHIKPVG